MVNNVTIESGERQVMYGVEIMRVGLFTTINFRYHNLTIMWDGGESAARGRIYMQAAYLANSITTESIHNVQLRHIISAVHCLSRSYLFSIP